MSNTQSNTGGYRRRILTIRKFRAGREVVDNDWPKKFNITHAFTGFPPITNEYLATMPEAEYIARLQAFYIFLENATDFFNSTLIPNINNNAINSHGYDEISCPVGGGQGEPDWAWEWLVDHFICTKWTGTGGGNATYQYNWLENNFKCSTPEDGGTYEFSWDGSTCSNPDNNSDVSISYFWTEDYTCLQQLSDQFIYGWDDEFVCAKTNKAEYQYNWTAEFLCAFRNNESYLWDWTFDFLCAKTILQT